MNAGRPDPNLMSPSCIDSDLVLRAQEAMDRLVHNKMTLVTAESCTGGLICSALAQADGAGDALQGGFVEYSKSARRRCSVFPPSS